MRHTVCILIAATLLSACSKQTSTISDLPSQQAMKPKDCTRIGTVSHPFRGGTVQSADEYLCTIPDFPEMECHFYETAAGKREMNCMASLPAITANIDCKYSASGWRYFFETNRTFGLAGNLLGATAHDCGMRYQMRCHFFQHDPDSDDANRWQDLQCVDDMDIP